MIKRDFFRCGLTGWCLEVFWTGIHSLLEGNFTMMGKTYAGRISAAQP